MDLHKLKCKDILNENFYDEYLLQHKKFYYEIVEINVHLVMIEKLMEYHPLTYNEKLYSEEELIRIIHRMIMLHLPLRICRISLDQGANTYTIRGFKNNVINNIEDDSVKNYIKQEIKPLIKESNDFAKRLKEARDNFLAHKLMPFSNSNDDEDRIFFEFEELKEYILELTEYFKLLTFDVESNFHPHYDNYEVDIREQAIKRIGDNIDTVFLKLLNNNSQLT